MGIVPRWAVLAGATVASSLAFIFAIREGAVLASLFAAAGPVIVLASVVVELRRRGPMRVNEALMQKAAEHVDVGRKLVIYERETGLFAHWYISLRCDEECHRAGRYKHQLALVAIEPAPESDVWTVQDDIANWLRWRLRTTDLAAYVGNACYVVLMPESDATAARKAVERLRTDIETVEIGISSFPDDGADFEQLLAAARERLSKVAQSAA